MAEIKRKEETKIQKTNIEWVKNPDGTPGYTWNPLTGCLNHVNGMCKGGNFPCYAYRLAHGRLKARYLANNNYVTWRNTSVDFYDDKEKGSQFYKAEIDAPFDPFYPRFWEYRLYEPVNKMRRWGRQTQVLHQQSPKGIFVCDMSDLFGIGIPEEWTRRVLERFQYAPQHRFYLLTKQPQNLIKFSPFPDNCWVGVTATNAEMLMRACSNLEYPVQAKVKYLSVEPFLDWSYEWTQSYLINSLKRAGINWLIIGGQTRPTVNPKIEAVQEIVEAADKAGIPVFLKNNLSDLLEIRKEADWKTHIPFYRAGQLRQEIPEERR